MGKTWGARCFRRLGVPVHDADACVHRLMGSQGAATQKIGMIFSGVIGADGSVDRQKLANCVLGDDVALERLEAIVHPLVHQQQRQYLQRCRRRSVPLVVLDIPLLYETESRARVDAVVVMSAPQMLQRQRVLRRAGMTTKKLNAIQNRQMPDSIKRKLAEFVVSTAGTRGQSLRQIAKVVKICRTLKGEVWGPHWGC